MRRNFQRCTETKMTPQMTHQMSCNIYLSFEGLHEVLLNIVPYKSCGWQRITLTLKLTAELATPVYRRFKLQGMLQNVLKLTHVFPIFKSGDKKMLNYRRVSLLHLICKGIETAINFHLKQFYEPILCSEQQGFG